MLCSLSLWAADSAAGADVLNRWVGGKWVGSGQFVDSAYSKANTASRNHQMRVVARPRLRHLRSGHRLRWHAACATFRSTASLQRPASIYFYGISLGEEKARNTALDITDSGERWVYSEHQRN